MTLIGVARNWVCFNCPSLVLLRFLPYNLQPKRSTVRARGHDETLRSKLLAFAVRACVSMMT